MYWSVAGSLVTCSGPAVVYNLCELTTYGSIAAARQLDEMLVKLQLIIFTDYRFTAAFLRPGSLMSC